MMMMMMSSNSMKPAWLEGLMAETFFGGCGVHENRRKNEKNVYCLLCCLSICPHCLPSHRSHPLLQGFDFLLREKENLLDSLFFLTCHLELFDGFLFNPFPCKASSSVAFKKAKVRRYVYHDVVRLGDLEKLIDCSYIQPYTINSAKVIFLNQRPQSRSCKGSANNCFTCDRMLQDPFRFCSLSCKVNHLVDQGEDLSAIIYRINESDFAFSQLEGLRMDSSEIIDDEGQITPSSILENPLQYRGSSCSSDTVGSSGIAHEPAEVLKKKKKKWIPSGEFLLPEQQAKGISSQGSSLLNQTKIKIKNGVNN
ncbi:hypothetical protein OIU85_026546 [Salix viminalis]|uniref:B box-type domain-containing protein n=1 Tax=Salix viminalis TaxID=40686 RepID=A0A9Q0TNX8_SALVM|nr:hypothetical protein OIU85_026546 [Salix viminalis]